MCNIQLSVKIYSIHSYARFFYNHSKSSISVINIAHALLGAIGAMTWKKMVIAHCSLKKGHYHKQINTQPFSFQIVRINSPPYMMSPLLLKTTLHCSNDGQLSSKRKERRSHYGRVKDITMNSKIPLQHFYYYYFFAVIPVPTLLLTSHLP